MCIAEATAGMERQAAPLPRVHLGRPLRRLFIRRRSLRPVSILMAIGISWMPLAGCEEEEPLPPPKSTTTAPAAAPEIDLKHSAAFKADRNLTIPNLQLIIQPDPAGSDLTGLTLLSVRPGADGSHMLFGTTQSLASLDRLTSTEFHFAGTRFLDTRGNGIFTSMVSYQPKFAALKITKAAAGEATGTISGEFYRFKASSPLARPEVVEVEAAFAAMLTIK